VLALGDDGDYIQVPDSPNLNPAGVLTIEAWVYPKGVGVGNGIILMKQEPTGTKGASYGLVYHVDFAAPAKGLLDKVSFAVETVDNPWNDYPSDTVLETNTWSHVAGTYKSGELKVYLNGNLEKTYTLTGKITPTSGPLYIGHAWWPWVQEQFNGIIDEVRIWNIARTQEDIQATISTTLQGNEEGLVSYWNFDDGTAIDLTPNENNGILVGGAQIGMACFTVAEKIGEHPLTLQFTPVTREPHIDSYLWDFGDGNTSKEPNPIHTYQNEEPYTVSLTVTANGETDTVTHDILYDRREFVEIGLPRGKSMIRDELQLELFRIKFAKAAHLMDIVSDFLTREGVIRADPRTNYIIVMDVPIGVKRASIIIEALDVPMEER